MAGVVVIGVGARHANGGSDSPRQVQWLKKMSQCLHDLERSDWCDLLT